MFGDVVLCKKIRGGSASSAIEGRSSEHNDHYQYLPASFQSAARAYRKSHARSLRSAGTTGVSPARFASFAAAGVSDMRDT